MPMYRKKPVVIKAVQWNGHLPDFQEFEGWENGIPIVIAPLPAITIQTLEGDMRADPGDWIIRGVKGEFYPCKPDIFAATYEPADAAPTMAARIAELEAALDLARSYITAHRDELLRDFCVIGTMDRSTMDEDEAEYVADADRLIEAIDRALAAPGDAS